jgi:hypothetical protein
VYEYRRNEHLVRQFAEPFWFLETGSQVIL